MVERPSRSTVKIEVGTLKNGEKRYEIRHLNDLKLAHEDSPAAPIHRSRLGRPSKPSVPAEVSPSTEADPQPSVFKSKQQTPDSSTGRNPVAGANKPDANHETSSHLSHDPAPSRSALGDDVRPIRTTRNKNPQYVDAFHESWSSRPWSASPAEIASLNQCISQFRAQ